MFLKIDRTKPGLRTLQLNDFCYPLIAMAELVVVQGERAFTAVLTAIHTSRRAQAARIIGQYQYLIDANESGLQARSERPQQRPQEPIMFVQAAPRP